MSRSFPRLTLLLGGALRFTEYDYFQEQVVKFIVLKRGDACGHGSSPIGSPSDFAKRTASMMLVA